MKRFLLRLGAFLLLLAAVPAVYVGLTLFRASGGLPQWDGDIQVPGLSAAARIRRDALGIPYIEADTERDLYYAQGFVHAQDRFWQMALARQAMLGRLAEWLGAPAVRNDRIARTWGWASLARRSLETLPAEDRELLEAYADGVNAWLASAAYRRPPEMVVLHVEPEQWRAEDPYLIGYGLNRLLSNPGGEQARARFGPETYGIFDTTSLPVRPIIPSSRGDEIMQPTAAVKRRGFSDNWTLSGEHTQSGRPLMANDPQLAIGLPGTWQLQHHTLDSRRMAGGTLPGVAGIVAGHNGSIAWGITNAVLDSVDLAFLEIDSSDAARYRQGPSAEWLTFNERTEEIRVRFGADVSITVRTTPYGVVWPPELQAPLVEDRENVVLELREVAADAPGEAAASFVRLNRAESVAEGIAALARHNAPALNISLADSAGDIGYVTAGRIPQRPVAHATGVGFAPEDGNDWAWIPYEQNPRVINPPGGRIVTANQRIVGREYPHYLTDRWLPPYRARRIHELLDETERHDAESFTAMQMDALSPVARELTPLMLRAEPASGADAKVLEILKDWDYRFSLDAAAPVVWLTWVDALRRRMLEDELAPLSTGRAVFMYAPLTRALSGERSEWCDDTTTPDREDCGGLLQASLAEASASLTEAFGEDLETIRWGRAALFRIPHQGFAGLPLLDGMFSRQTVWPGGPESLFVNGVVTTNAPRFSTSSWSSSYQAIYDLADLGASLFMAPGGPSGHFRSPYYNNLTASWVAGERIALDPDAVSASHALTLRPSAAGATAR